MFDVFEFAVFSSVMSFLQCSSGVSFSSCFAQKKLPLLWYVLRFGKKRSGNSFSNFSAVTVSGSVLSWPFVISSIAVGPAPQMISCRIAGSFVFQSVCDGAVPSVRIDFISMSWFLFRSI